jgi:hypothetical protein
MSIMCLVAGSRRRRARRVVRDKLRLRLRRKVKVKVVKDTAVSLRLRAVKNTVKDMVVRVKDTAVSKVSAVMVLVRAVRAVRVVWISGLTSGRVRIGMLGVGRLVLVSGFFGLGYNLVGW